MAHQIDNHRIHKYSLSGIPTLVDSSLELSGAAALICTLGGRAFRKRNAGFAIAAYWRDIASGDYSGPMLVSEIPSCVTYYTSYDNQDITYLGTVQYDERTYYYSNTGQFMGGNPTDSSGTGRIKLTATAVGNAVIELLNRYFKNGY